MKIGEWDFQVYHFSCNIFIWDKVTLRQARNLHHPRSPISGKCVKIHRSVTIFCFCCLSTRISCKHQLIKNKMTTLLPFISILKGLFKMEDFKKPPKCWE